MLEQRITAWRAGMLAAGIQSPVPLDELEAHLREQIESKIQSGASEEEAFAAAVEDLGAALDLKAEFAKIGNTMYSRIIGALSFTAVLLAASWLIFFGVMTARSLAPADGLVSMRVSDGATVRVQHGVPELLSYGTLSSGGEWHIRAAAVALLIPFLILVAFATLGCHSLLRKQIA